MFLPCKVKKSLIVEKTFMRIFTN